MKTIKSGNLVSRITGALLTVLVALSFSGATYAGLPTKQQHNKAILEAKKRKTVITRNAAKQAPEPAPRQAPEPAPRQAPKPAPRQAPEPAPRQAPELAPRQAPEPAPKQAPEPAPRQAPEPAPRQAPEPAPRQAPEPAPRQAPKPAPRQAPKPAPRQAPKPAPRQAPKPAPRQAPEPVILKDFMNSSPSDNLPEVDDLKKEPRKEPKGGSTTNSDDNIPPSGNGGRKKFEDEREKFKNDFSMEDEGKASVEDEGGNSQGTDDPQNEDAADKNGEEQVSEVNTIFDANFINAFVDKRNFSNDEARRYNKGSYTDKLAKAFVHAYNHLPPVKAKDENWKGQEFDGLDPASEYGVLTADDLTVGGRPHPVIDGDTFKYYPVVTGALDSASSNSRFVSLKVKLLKGTNVCGEREGFDGYFSVSFVNSGGQAGGWGVFVSTYGLPKNEEDSIIRQCFGQNFRTPFAEGSGYNEVQFAGLHGKWSTEALLLLIATGKARWNARQRTLILPEEGYKNLQKYLETRTVLDRPLTNEEFAIEQR